MFQPYAMRFVMTTMCTLREGIDEVEVNRREMELFKLPPVC